MMMMMVIDRNDDCFAVDITECEQWSSSQTGPCPGSRNSNSFQCDECQQSDVDTLSTAGTQGLSTLLNITPSIVAQGVSTA